MKVYRILYIIIPVFIISCNSGGHLDFCPTYKLQSAFTDTITGFDITGDSINLPTIRYNKDSIRYKIVSEEDSTEYLFPIVTKGSWSYEYTFNGFNVNKNTNRYTMIIYYNENELDSLFITIPKEGVVEIFHTENLKLRTGTPRSECSSFLIIGK